VSTAPLASERDPLWSEPCLAYNLHVELDAACRDDFAEVQGRLHRTCSGTLVCPPASLHVSVATILSVRRDYGTSKEVIRARWGNRWLEGLREVVAGLQPFEVHFDKLAVSKAAVVAVAEPVPEIDLIRARAKELVSLAGVNASQPSIVHCTLLRYGTSGLDLGDLARLAAGVDLSTKTVVTNVVVSRELVYPNLVNEVLQRFQIGQG
jgi:2'-5' RNA ligase